jgi:hypothetical protein
MEAPRSTGRRLAVPDLFVSYSRDDRVFMCVLRDNLRRLGFNARIDEEHLEVGTPD